MENYLIHSIAINLSKKINQFLLYEGIQFQKIVLGLEILIINISKLIIIFILAIVLHIFPQSFATIFAFSFLRRSCFGIHARNSTICTLVSIFLFIVIPYMIKGFYANNNIVFICYTIILFLLYRYAPSDTESRPIIGLENRKRLKRNAMISGIILMLLSFLIPNKEYALLFIVGSIYESISILPVTYKILKRKERNYEKHEANLQG